jgi:predicted peptidase
MRFRPVISMVLLVGLVASGCRDSEGATAQTPPAAAVPQIKNFVRRTVVDRGVAYPYQVFLPAAFDSARKWPVIVALHGSGERGTDGEVPTRFGLGPVVRAQAATFPAIVIFVQIPLGDAGPDIGQRNAMRELDATLAEFHGDRDRVYLTGLSFGGTLAMNLAFQYTDRFAAFVPIASGMCPRCIADFSGAPRDQLYAVIGQRLRTLPTWIFHGEKDSRMPVEFGRQIARALESAGAPVRYTEYPGEGHDVWDKTYRNPELFTWLFAQRRTP